MAGAPGLQAMIAPTQADPLNAPADPSTRNNYDSTLRLFQVDFAVRDKSSENGWVVYMNQELIRIGVGIVLLLLDVCGGTTRN